MSGIILQNIKKRFFVRNEELLALQNINIQVAPSEFVSMVGPSGCGKSTLIRMIIGLIKPTEGQIEVDGIQYRHGKRLPPQLSQKMGFVFQSPNLFPWLTLRQNIYLPLRVFKLKGSGWIRYADELIESAELTAYADRYPRTLSQGTLQRAGVIRAMVHKPKILLMDEPYGALDDGTRERMDLELLKLWRNTGMTILFITHNISEAILLSQRVYVMNTAPGRICDELSVKWRSKNTVLFETQEFNGYYKRIHGAIAGQPLADIV